jgi:hypothetical protein
MNKNSIICILIIFILLCIILYFYIKKHNTKESFLPWDFNKNEENKPEFIKNYENNYKKDDILNYRYENITQYNFNKLYETLKKVNKENINLKDKANYNFYTQSTTQDKLRMNLDIISKYVILILNNENYYDFEKTNYGDVEEWIDKEGNEELKYELFLWDKKNYFQLKLLVNIIKFIDTKDINKYGIEDKQYIFQDFNIGYPFKDQIIPLPIDVSITGHEDLAIKSIKANEPSKIKYLYLNSVEVQNSTLVVNYNKDKYPFNRLDVNENDFSGVTDSTLEYIKIKEGTDNNPYYAFSREYNKWPTLDSEPKWKAQYPSKNPPHQWNVDGIYYYGEKDDIAFDPNKCDITEGGIAWSAEKMPLQPNFWPTLATLPRNCGEYYNMFDLSNGPVGGNTFIGGGKR